MEGRRIGSRLVEGETELWSADARTPVLVVRRKGRRGEVLRQPGGSVVDAERRHGAVVVDDVQSSASGGCRRQAAAGGGRLRPRRSGCRRLLMKTIDVVARGYDRKRHQVFTDLKRRNTSILAFKCLHRLAPLYQHSPLPVPG